MFGGVDVAVLPTPKLYSLTIERRGLRSSHYIVGIMLVDETPGNTSKLRVGSKTSIKNLASRIRGSPPFLRFIEPGYP